MSDQSASSPLLGFSTALADLVRDVAPSLVSVQSERARSTGFSWRPGLIVAAENALPDDGEISIAAHDGASSPAQIIGRDPSTDVALMRVARTDLPRIAAAAQTPAAGALAVVAGARDGAPTAALGVVSFLGPQWRSLRGGVIDARIELDAALARSSEGGLALDARGQPFGMAVFGPRRRTLVIPMATVGRVAELLAAKGRIARGYLGLGLQPVKLDAGGNWGDGDQRRREGAGRRGRRPAGRHHCRLERRADPRRPSSGAGAGTRQRWGQRQALVAPSRRAGRTDAHDRRAARGPMTGEPPVVVAIEIGEPQLADRLAALLADVPGLRLAAPGEPADAALVIPGEPPPAPDVALTPRELDVLALIAEGASNKVIARRLAISIHTVKFHIASLLDKLDAQGRAEAVAQGARLGAIKL